LASTEKFLLFYSQKNRVNFNYLAPQNNMEERQIISADDSIAPEVLKAHHKKQSKGAFGEALRSQITDAETISAWKCLRKLNTSDAM